MHIVLLCGGTSSERDISLRSGKNIALALRKAGYAVDVLDPATDISRLIKNKNKYTVAFLALHGVGGEDGSMQGLLESIHLPYTGSGILASALAMNKEYAKKIFRATHLITPPSYEKPTNAEMKNGLVIKPVSAGSSIGVQIVSRRKDLTVAIQKAKKSDIYKKYIIEKQIHGRELTVAVLGNTHPVALPVIEIKSKNTFFDLASKYDPALCDEICPAHIPKKITKHVQELACRAHRALGCRGFSRTDIMWETKTNSAYILETNTLPGMTEASLMPKAAKAAGYTFIQLIEKMIDLACEPV